MRRALVAVAVGVWVFAVGCDDPLPPEPELPVVVPDNARDVRVNPDHPTRVTWTAAALDGGTGVGCSSADCCDGRDDTCNPNGCYCDEFCCTAGDCCEDYEAACGPYGGDSYPECRGDVCDPPCDDGQWCNGTETCSAGVCVPGTPPSCDDGQWCNGTETCNEATDSCDPGTPPDCDDGQWCNGTEVCNETSDSCLSMSPPTCDDGQWCNGTETCNEATDSCDPGTPECTDPGYTCNETLDECECIDCACGDGPPLTGTISTKGDIKKGLKLPFVKASIKGDFGYDIGGSYSPANCPECKSSLSIEGTGELSAKLATVEVKAGLTGTFGGSNEYCLECDDDTCEQYCGDLKCKDISGSLEGFAEVTKTYGLPKLSANWGKYSLSFKCGVDVSPRLDGHGDASKTIPGSCDPCPSCTSYGGGGGFGVSAKASCGLSVRRGRKKLAGVGCDECFTLYGDVDLSGSKQFGDCTDQTCVKLVGKAGAKGHVGACLGWGWFKAYVNCGADVWGKGTTDSCGPSGLTGGAKLWCHAKSCKKKCMCCDGSWSPTCTPSDGSWGGCCSSHGGICDGRCM